MTNPHRVAVLQIGTSYHAICAADDCDWQHVSRSYSDAAVRGITHRVAHERDREIRRRVDWQEPMEDT